ncbi:MAG: O-antigen ligase family protein [Ruminococcus sp.]|nr:O-antigen ligase family protein [Ruminococcus sp.]
MKKLRMIFLDTSMFRLLFMLSMFFSMVMYVERVAYVLTYVLFIWGAGLSVYSVVKRKAYATLYLGVWLMAFLASFTITVLVNINSNLQAVAYNLLMLVHAGVCFFVFYGMHTERGVPFRWELYLMVRVIVYLSTVFTFIGLVMMLFTKGRFDNYMYYQGVFKGFYTNPNYQGYVSALSVIFCHMLTKPNFIAHSGQKRVSRIWLASCILLNCVALLLCDSTGSLLLLVAYAAIIVLMKVFSMIEDLNFRKMIIRIVTLVAVGIVVLAVMLFVRVACRVGVAVFFSDTVLSSEQIKDLASDALFVPKTDTGVSSRWFLWDAGIKLFKQNPLFGIGKGNLHDGIISVTGRENLNSQFEGFVQIAFTDLHNGYLTILVTAGVIGAVFFFAFLVRYLSMILPVWFVHRRIMVYSVYPCLIAFIGAYLCYTLIEKTLLFDVTYLVMSFWLIVGYTSCYAIDQGYNRRGNLYIFNMKLHKKLI